MFTKRAGRRIAAAAAAFLSVPASSAAGLRQKERDTTDKLISADSMARLGRKQGAHLGASSQRAAGCDETNGALGV